MPGWVLWNLMAALVLAPVLLLDREMPDGLRTLFVLALALCVYGVWWWWTEPRRRREGDVPGQWRTPPAEDD